MLPLPLSYAPYLSGRYEVSTPGLKHFQPNPTQPEQRLIQIDRQFPRYRANKEACRKTEPRQYILEQDFFSETRRQANLLLIKQLCSAYPELFQWKKEQGLNCQLTGEFLRFGANQVLQDSPYTNLWEALAAQIQEDLALWQVEGPKDWLAALHVCAPNGWAPAHKIGQNFDRVHRSVPGMERQRTQYHRMLAGLIHKPAFVRFIWDLRTRNSLNLHPQIVSELPPFQATAPELYVRVERQVLHGLPKCNAVLFLIRTYVYEITTLKAPALRAILNAVRSMPPDLLAYKQLASSSNELQTWLQAQIAQAEVPKSQI